jgi:hypothetical protein
MNCVRFAAALPLVIAVAACSTEADSDVAKQDQDLVSDIAKMTGRGDGTFDVTCRDGRTEIATAEDVTSGRVCKPAVLPASPFEANACTGEPMTAAAAAARLGANGAPVKIGSFALALRRRESTGSGWNRRNYWVDAPNDTLSAWRKTGYSETSGRRATFTNRGTVEVAANANGTPYVRLVGEAVHEVGPDTTRWLRLVSKPIQRWPAAAPTMWGPELEIESKVGDGAWSRVTEYGWSVQTTEFHLIGTSRSWWFEGPGVTAIMTKRCGQFISAQSESDLSPARAAIGIAIAFD